MFNTAWDSSLLYQASWHYTPHSVELLRGKKFLEGTCLLIVVEEIQTPSDQIYKQINACLSLGLTSTHPLSVILGPRFHGISWLPRFSLSLKGYEFHPSRLKWPSRCIKYDRKEIRELHWCGAKHPAWGMGRWGGGGPWGPFWLEPAADSSLGHIQL